MALTLLSALLFILAFPVAHVDFSLWPVAFVSLVPLFRFLDTPVSLGRKALAGFVWGALMSLGLAYWLFYAMVWQYGTSVVTAIVFMLAGLMLPHGLVFGAFAAVYAIVRRERPVFYALVVPSLWVMADFARESFPLLVPWGFIGYALQPWNAYLQAADIGGVAGLSFLTVAVNGCAAWLLRGVTWRDLRAALRPGLAGRFRALVAADRAAVIVLLAALAVPPAYGLARRAAVRGEVDRRLAAGKGEPAAAVQANFGQRERWSAGGFVERVNLCLNLSRKSGIARGAADEGPGAKGAAIAKKDDDAAPARGIIVWPETVLNSQGMVNSRLFDYIRTRAPGPRLIVAGGVRRIPGRQGVCNTAYLIEGRGDTLYYDKNILLPYAESAPFGDFLGDFYTAPTEFVPGDSPPAARTDAGVIGVSICLEAVYPWHARASARAGAGLLVNISNDGWFGKTSMPVLHLRQASVRAVENRRFMVRASNNGYSAIIAPTGEIAARSRLFAREVVAGEIVMLDTRTPWTVLGDWMLYAAAGVALAALGMTVFRKEG